MSKPSANIACEILINNRNEVCIITSQRLPNEPQWAEFDARTAALYLVYTNGNIYNLDFRIDKSLIPSLLQAKKILVICLENNKPSEGYDINLISINS